MRQDVEERCLAMAEHMARTGDTVRETARAFQVSKSLAHRELTVRLRGLNPGLHRQIRALLLYHKAVRHLRGGEATTGGFCMKKPFLWRIMDNIVIFFSKKWRTVPIFSEKKRENGILRRIHTA